MYEKIVVPLDGSKLAECVLPYVEELARDCKTKEVVLVTAVPRIVGGLSPSQQSRPIEPLPVPAAEPPAEAGMKVPVALGKSQSQAQKYLSRIVKQLSEKGISVRWEVLLGQPAEAITAFTEQTGADLIALASHGRSGPSRWAFGSVAEKVFRASSIPVLMVRAPGSAAGV